MLTVKNCIYELERIYGKLDDISKQFGFSDEIQSNLCVCMDEVFSNIVHYAYEDNGEHIIEISFDFDAATKKLRIVIVDDGKPFNPLETETPDLSVDLFEREIGGLGIFIVTNIMTSVEYQRLESVNRLEMTKNVE